MDTKCSHISELDCEAGWVFEIGDLRYQGIGECVVRQWLKQSCRDLNQMA